jgi:hypothetical protein
MMLKREHDQLYDGEVRWNMGTVASTVQVQWCGCGCRYEDVRVFFKYRHGIAQAWMRQ